jgi:hypothetical protein
LLNSGAARNVNLKWARHDGLSCESVKFGWTHQDKFGRPLYRDLMSDPSFPPADEAGGIGALSVLLNGAADSFRTVAVTYRTWRHEQRAREAFRADIERQPRRGFTFGAVGTGDPGLAETKETVRMWRDGERIRQEHHGGWRDGSYGVVDGPRWWSWNEQTGAVRSRDDSSAGGGGLDRALDVMLDPAALVAVLEWRVAGHSRIAGRATLTAHATLRHDALRDVRAPGYPRVFRALHALGVGADSYHLEIDQQRGVLLAATAIRNGQPFSTITTLTISFDDPIPAETFIFRTPDGAPIHSRREHFIFPQHVTVSEAQRRAPFTVLVPDPLPRGWRPQPRCRYMEAWSWSSAIVTLAYFAAAGGQRVSMVQLAAADAPRAYGMLFDDQSWQEVLRDGTPIRIRPAGEMQPQAYLTRHGTFVYFESAGLTVDELATIAASLRPVPNTEDG